MINPTFICITKRSFQFVFIFRIVVKELSWFTQRQSGAVLTATVCVLTAQENEVKMINLIMMVEYAALQQNESHTSIKYTFLIGNFKV